MCKQGYLKIRLVLVVLCFGAGNGYSGQITIIEPAPVVPIPTTSGLGAIMTLTAPANAKVMRSPSVGRQSGFLKPVNLNNAYVFEYEVAKALETQFVPWALSMKSQLKSFSHMGMPPDSPNHVLLSAVHLAQVMQKGPKPERNITGNPLDTQRMLTLKEAHHNLKADYNKAILQIVKTNPSMLQKEGVVSYLRDIVKAFDGAEGAF